MAQASSQSRPERDYSRTPGRGRWVKRVPYHSAAAARNEPCHPLMARLHECYGGFMLGGYRDDDHNLMAVLIKDVGGWWLHFNRDLRLMPKRVGGLADQQTVVARANQEMRRRGFKVPR